MPLPVQTESALIESVPILGRKSELRQLLKALTLCRSGQGKAILLTGSEGIGKTTVLKSFLELSKTAFECQTIYIACPEQSSAPLLYCAIIQSILEAAQQQLQSTLQEINTQLEPVGLRWSPQDLMQLLSLIGLQESMGTRQSFTAEKLSQSLAHTFPALRRRGEDSQALLLNLARHISHPNILLASSLLNPLNPHMQEAKLLVEKIMGQKMAFPSHFTVQSPLLLSGESSTSLSSTEETEINSSYQASDLQNTLANLFTAINEGLKGTQTAWIFALDQWDRLLTAPEGTISEINDLFSGLLRSTVEQRDTRLMLIISSRSDAESYVFNAALFNALRTKLLIPGWPAALAQKYFVQNLATSEVIIESPSSELLPATYGQNPGCLKLLSTYITETSQNQAIKTLSQDTLQERYRFTSPLELIEMLYSRLQLNYVGQEGQLQKALQLLLQGFSAQSFTSTQAQGAFTSLLTQPDWVNTLLKQLTRLGYLEEIDSAYQFYTPFTLGFLQHKVHPAQEDVPTPDKVVALKKVLPLSIQSGELTLEKVQDLLNMASVMEQPDLTEFVESTLIDALDAHGTPDTSKPVILHSLAYIGSGDAILALLNVFEKSSSELWHLVAKLLAPLAQKIPREHQENLQEKLFRLLEQDSPEARQSALLLLLHLPMAPDEQTAMILSYTDDHDPGVQKIVFHALSQKQSHDPRILEMYTRLLNRSTDPKLISIAIKGVSQFPKDQAVPVLVNYLKTHLEEAHAPEALSALMQLQFEKAFPMIETLLVQPQNDTLKLSLIKRLGSVSETKAEQILIGFLEKPGPEGISPELRWMTIRSLGRIGHSANALQALKQQEASCVRDEILQQSLRTAMTCVSERLNRVFSQIEATHQPPSTVITANKPQATIEVL